MSYGELLNEIIIDAELRDMANGLGPMEWLQAMLDYDWTREDGGPPWDLSDE